MRHARRDGAGRLLAADESAAGIPQLLCAGEDAVSGISQRQQGGQGQQGQQDQSEQQNQQERQRGDSQISAQELPREVQPEDRGNEVQPCRQEADCNLLGHPVAAMNSGDDAITDVLAEQLLPLAANDGLFEVLHPDGSVLSVAVTQTPVRVSLLLSTTSERDNAQLQNCKMELEQRMGRRIGKDVVIAIL